MFSISIVIVSWNVSALLLDCLSSIFASPTGALSEVIVVDSASADDTVSLVQQRFPQVRLIALSENVGFARANNIGLAAASGDFILLLNPDTRILGDAIGDALLALVEPLDDRSPGELPQHGQQRQEDHAGPHGQIGFVGHQRIGLARGGAVARCGAMFGCRAVYLHGRLTNLYEPSGQLANVAFVFRDVSDERRMEKLQRDFLSLMSHKLKTPTTIVDGYLKLITSGKYGELPEPMRKAFSLIESRLTDLKLLIEKLLQYASLSAEELRHEAVIPGLAREERPEYPLFAVREALVNAVCHRDYGIKGLRVEIRMFDDRLEVQSPGGLPGYITLDNIVDEHFSRNPRIVNGLFQWGFIEELGLGIDRMIESMVQAGHPQPTFRATPYSFTVILQNIAERAAIQPTSWQSNMNERQLHALQYLQQHGRITNRDYRELCLDVFLETLCLDLADLVERGLLMKIGDKRGTYYILK